MVSVEYVIAGFRNLFLLEFTNGCLSPIITEHGIRVTNLGRTVPKLEGSKVLDFLLYL